MQFKFTVFLKGDKYISLLSALAAFTCLSRSSINFSNMKNKKKWDFLKSSLNIKILDYFWFLLNLLDVAWHAELISFLLLARTLKLTFNINGFVEIIWFIDFIKSQPNWHYCITSYQEKKTSNNTTTFTFCCFWVNRFIKILKNKLIECLYHLRNIELFYNSFF